MSEGNEGGFAERGNQVGTAGGLSQPGGPNTSSGGTGNQNSGSNSGVSQSQHATGMPSQNFASAFNTSGISYGVPAYGTPYGITPFNVPRKDQTLQDRMFGSLGSGMVGTSFGGPSGTNNSNYMGRPAPRAPVTRRVTRRNPRTGVLETHYVNFSMPPKTMTSGFQINPDAGWAIPREGTINLSEMFPNYEGGTLYNDPYGYDAFPSTGYRLDPGGIFNMGQNKDQSRIGGAGRQFGGPVVPGGQYTVGEHGPETLRMNRDGGGQVIPHNRMDRLRGQRPFKVGGDLRLRHFKEHSNVRR